jgi:hypothetical protein
VRAIELEAENAAQAAKISKLEVSNISFMVVAEGVVELCERGGCLLQGLFWTHLTARQCV